MKYMLMNKYETDFKFKRKKITPKQEYQLLKNTHEAIISQEDYDKVQQMRGNRTKKDNRTYIYLLRGLVYCKNCGRKMTYKNSNPVRIDANGKITGKPNDIGYFICEEHYRHIDVCNQSNKIMEKTLNELVLKKVSDRLKQLPIGKYAIDVQEVIERQDSNMNNCKNIKNEIEKKEAEFKILYSKKVEGVISDEEFFKQYQVYKEATSKLKEKMNRFQKNQNNFNIRTEIERFIIAFSNTKKLDNAILKKLVDKIEIGKDEEVIITLKV